MSRNEHNATVSTVDTDVRHRQSSVEPFCSVLTESPLRTATATTAAAAAGGGDGHHGDELRDAFQVFDKDKDGFLNATDLRSVSMWPLDLPV